MPGMNTITRIYVRRYSDTGQLVAYVEWSNGSRTVGPLTHTNHPKRLSLPTFGSHMHALMGNAHRAGLRLVRETW